MLLLGRWLTFLGAIFTTRICLVRITTSLLVIATSGKDISHVINTVVIGPMQDGMHALRSFTDGPAMLAWARTDLLRAMIA